MIPLVREKFIQPSCVRFNLPDRWPIETIGNSAEAFAFDLVSLLAIATQARSLRILNK